MSRDRIRTLGWRAAIAFDVLVPVAIGAALVIFLVLIYFSCQLTILSNRVTATAQYIALRELGEPKTVSDGPHRG